MNKPHRITPPSAFACLIVVWSLLAYSEALLGQAPKKPLENGSGKTSDKVVPPLEKLMDTAPDVSQDYANTLDHQLSSVRPLLDGPFARSIVDIKKLTPTTRLMWELKVMHPALLAIEKNRNQVAARSLFSTREGTRGDTMANDYPRLPIQAPYNDSAQSAAIVQFSHQTANAAMAASKLANRLRLAGHEFQARRSTSAQRNLNLALLAVWQGRQASEMRGRLWREMIIERLSLIAAFERHCKESNRSPTDAIAEWQQQLTTRNLPEADLELFKRSGNDQEKATEILSSRQLDAPLLVERFEQYKRLLIGEGARIVAAKGQLESPEVRIWNQIGFLAAVSLQQLKKTRLSMVWPKGMAKKYPWLITTNDADIKNVLAQSVLRESKSRDSLKEVIPGRSDVYVIVQQPSGDHPIPLAIRVGHGIEAPAGQTTELTIKEGFDAIPKTPRATAPTRSGVRLRISKELPFPDAWFAVERNQPAIRVASLQTSPLQRFMPLSPGQYDIFWYRKSVQLPMMIAENVEVTPDNFTEVAAATGVAFYRPRYLTDDEFNDSWWGVVRRDQSTVLARRINDGSMFCPPGMYRLVWKRPGQRKPAVVDEFTVAPGQIASVFRRSALELDFAFPGLSLAEDGWWGAISKDGTVFETNHGRLIVPEGTYDILWKKSARHNTIKIATNVKVAQHECVRVRAEMSVTLEVPEWAPPRNPKYGMWAVVKSGDRPDQPGLWTNSDHTMLVSEGVYDVYWTQGYDHRTRPLLLKSQVAVTPSRPKAVVKVRGGLALRLPEKMPQGDKFRWWGVIRADEGKVGPLDQPVFWTKDPAAPLLLPRGRYHVIWKDGYYHAPAKLASEIEVSGAGLQTVNWICSIRWKLPRWTPPGDRYSWWGAVKSGEKPGKQFWTSTSDTILLPPGIYDLYFAQDYEHRNRPLMIRRGCKLSPGQFLSLSVQSGIKLIDPPKFQDRNGWWGVTKVGAKLEDKLPLHWAKDPQHALLLPPGEYDIWWKPDYQTTPMRSKASVNVVADALLEVSLPALANKTPMP